MERIASYELEEIDVDDDGERFITAHYYEGYELQEELDEDDIQDKIDEANEREDED